MENGKRTIKNKYIKMLKKKILWNLCHFFRGSSVLSNLLLNIFFLIFFRCKETQYFLMEIFVSHFFNFIH